MIKFTGLAGTETVDIWIAAQHIVSIRPNTHGGSVVITVECREDDHYRIQEPADEAAAMVNEALAELLGT